MTELAFAVRQDVFGVLAKLKKGPMEVWFLMLKLMEISQDYQAIPSKLRADARALVDAGIVQENERGMFRINPELAYVTREPTISEVLHEAA